MAIRVTGLTDASKTPGAVGELKYVQGKINVGAMPMRLQLFGNKTSDGTATADTTSEQCFSLTDAITRYGARSELTQMVDVALQYGIAPWVSPVLESAGAAGTWTLTFTGTTTAAGTYYLDICDCVIAINIDTGRTATQCGDDAVLQINKARRVSGVLLPITSANVTGTVTITNANLGLRGNQNIAHLDSTQKPAGSTAVLAGGTALSDGGIPATGGSGQDDVTNVLALLLPDECHYIAAAHNDAVNTDRIRDQMVLKNGPLVGLNENAVFALNTTQAAAVTLAQTTLNDPQCQFMFLKSCRTHPGRIATSMAALRAITEGADPNHRYNDQELLAVAVHKSKLDIPARSATDAMLDAGITPITTKNNKAKIVRAVTTYSLNGSSPDDRCVDVGNVAVAQRVRKEISTYWDAEYSVANPYAGPDDIEGLPPATGTATPKFFTAEVLGKMKDWEGPAYNWLSKVDTYPPVGEWNAEAKRIMCRVKTVAKPQNHQLGFVVEQSAG